MKRFLIVEMVLIVAVVAAIAGYFVVEEAPFLGASAFGGMTVLVVGGAIYLIHYARCLRQLDLPAEELGDREVLWAKTQQSMVHYLSGNPYKFWEAVGGKLFLTNEFLEFRASPAEYWVYRVMIPLSEVRDARPCTILGFIKGALRVERTDGSFELFTFGAAFDVSREWAHAILDFRDDRCETSDSSKQS
jgi:hypothetical protein